MRRQTPVWADLYTKLPTNCLPTLLAAWPLAARTAHERQQQELLRIADPNHFYAWPSNKPERWSHARSSGVSWLRERMEPHSEIAVTVQSDAVTRLVEV